MIDLTTETGKPTKARDRPEWVEFVEENGCWLICHRCGTKEYIGELHILDALRVSQRHFHCEKKRRKMVRTKFPEGGNENAILQTD